MYSMCIKMLMVRLVKCTVTLLLSFHKQWFFKEWYKNRYFVFYFSGMMMRCKLGELSWKDSVRTREWCTQPSLDAYLNIHLHFGFLVTVAAVKKGKSRSAFVWQSCLFVLVWVSTGFPFKLEQHLYGGKKSAHRIISTLRRKLIEYLNIKKPQTFHRM